MEKDERLATIDERLEIAAIEVVRANQAYNELILARIALRTMLRKEPS